MTFSDFSGRVVRCSLALPDICSWAGLRMFFGYFVLPTPPLSVEAGLGIRTPQKWHRTCFRRFGLGLDGPCRIPCYFPVSFCRPPPPAREPGATWIKLTTHTGAQDRLTFGANLSLFCRHSLVPPPLAAGMPMAFVDDVFLSLTARPSFLFTFSWSPLPAS